MRRTELKGLYWTFRKRADGTKIYYYYAWKGQPKSILSGEEVPLEIPRDHPIVAAYDKAHKDRTKTADGFIAGLLEAYQKSPEYAALAPRTRKDYKRWLDEIANDFGDMPLEAADERGVIKHFMAFRNKWAYSPRQADHAVMVLRLLLEFGRTRGLLDFNRADGIGKLYSVDKSEHIWTAADIDAACAHATPEVQRAIRLAAVIGLRLGDLVSLRWDQVMIDRIEKPTGKSGGKRIARIPLLPEARALLDECRAEQQRWAGAKSKAPRPLLLTVLCNTKGRQWSASGLSHAITDAATAAGVERTTHDLRRTCATRLASAGFEDQDIADWMGWTVASVQKLRRVYVDQGAVILSAMARLKRNESE